MSRTSLLPVRHPNADFFIPDIFNALPVKSDRHTMEHPFFALSTQKDIRSVKYEKDGVKIVLSPSAEYGLPTMMDKDVLLYIGSLIMAEINKGRIPPKTLRFSAHDLLVTTNRHTNDEGYRLLRNAFERIKGCTISTDIQTNGIKQWRVFSLIDDVQGIETSHVKKRMVRVQVTVSDWYYNALIGKEVLTINRDYFRLRKTLERRLYELARKHCGRQAEWSIGLENLKDKCGSRSILDKFRYQIREIIKTDHLPDYQIALDDQDKVTFSNRYHTVKKLLGAAGGLPNLDDLPRITPQTLRRAEKITSDAGTGWDHRALLEQFTAQLAAGFRPNNVNGAFIGFVKKKVATRP